MAVASMSGGSRRKRQKRYLCGVPDNYCQGSLTQSCNGLGKSCRSHGSPMQAFSCYANYLIKQGYKQVGPREFSSPNNGPIVVLTKKSKFGTMLRGGKGDRFMPSNFNSGGII